MAIVTTYREDAAGLEIVQTDFVEPSRDVLWRHYRVTRLPGSRVSSAGLISYLNFSPRVSKLDFLPLSDWCLDEAGGSSLVWQKSADFFLQSKEGTDASTGLSSAVNLAFGFDGQSAGHQAGWDQLASCTWSPQKRDAYFIAEKGRLPGSDSARGQVTAGISAELAFDDNGAASRSLIISAAKSGPEAVTLIESSRGKGFESAFEEVEEVWSKRLARVPLPAAENERIRALAMRSVISVFLGYCRDSGAGVASISTQPPYGLDWPRDGAFMNLALLEAGFPELARDRGLFWARVQSRPGDKIPFVPEGNWASNYFADGVPGFPCIWWEIDETGWAPWGMAAYYEATGDQEYLAKVYPSIARAADFLVEFRDPETGLHKKAYEDDIPHPRHSIHAAVPCYLALTHAALLAEKTRDEEAAGRWRDRAQELKDAMLEEFYDPVCGRFVHRPEDKGDCSVPGADRDGSLVLWPGGMLEPGDPRAEQAAEAAWENIQKSLRGERTRGMYEPYTLLALAHYWKGRPDKLERVKQGLAWAARVPVTDTLHFGEVWVKDGGETITGQAQPHLWHHALFYLAALEAFGKESPGGDGPRP